MANVKGRVDKSPCLLCGSVVYNLTTFQEWFVLYNEGMDMSEPLTPSGVQPVGQ